MNGKSNETADDEEEQMTNRERVLAIMNRQSPDRIPWIPRLKMWYNAHKRAGTLPERYRNLSLREVERALGMGDPAREGNVHTVEFDGVEVIKREKGGEEITEWRTPVGSVFKREASTPELDAAATHGRIIEYPLKGPADYSVWEYIAEHTRYTPTYEAYLEYEKKVGDDGYPLVSAGDVPLHTFLEKFAGYNSAFLQLADYTPQIEHLLTVMAQVEKERLWPVLLNSPAKLINHGSHFDSQITSPPLFRKYITPYYQVFSKLMHAKGKSLSFHADNDTRLLFKLVLECGYDMAESYTTAPMVKTTLRETREAWGTRVIIFGGIPSVLLTDAVSEEAFEQYMDDLFRIIAPGDAIILGVGDNIVPGAHIERVERVGQMVQERGTYPIKA
jgi:hypothetical protein